MQDSNPRRLAFDVLLRVLRGGAFAGVTLDATLRQRPGLDRRERALCTEFVYGTLRRTPSLDEAIALYSKRHLDRMDESVLVLLRLGAYQLLHMRVPAHAAVGETVALAREVGVGGASGFVNAVLRELSRKGAGQPPSFREDPARYLLLTEALPLWLYHEWSRQLSAKEVAQLAAALNSPAFLNLRASSSAHREDALAMLLKAGIEARAASHSHLGIVIEQGTHPENLPSWQELGLQAQDEGAQLVTEYSLLPGKNRKAGTGRPSKVLDACAAPGGKTCHLAQALPNSRVVAVDLHKRRAERVEEEARRLGLEDRVEVHAADATRPLPFARHEEFDLVLIDAPCTGLGTLRRRPEIKLTRSKEDMERLAGLQRKLLESLAPYVAEEGRLVYAVCTRTLAEGPSLIDEFLAKNPSFEPDPPLVELPRGVSIQPPADAEELAGAGRVDKRGVDEPRTPWNRLVASDGTLDLWTHQHGTDGFFAARLRRVATASSGH